MAIKHTQTKYQDNLVKHECLECEGQFITGQDTAKLTKSECIKCPYCYSAIVDHDIVRTDNECLRDMQMGCMGIYYEPE